LRTLHLFGVPLRAGSWYPGNENDARAYRDGQLVERLRAAGCAVHDEGDVAIPSYLPHHTIPPIRSWPAPRIAWESVGERVEPLLKQSDRVPLLIGCDCSVVVGSVQAMRSAGVGDLHVVYIDGDFDDAPPRATECQSAAAMGVWLLTHPSPFWSGPPLDPARVTVVGWSQPPQSDLPSGHSIPLGEVRGAGAHDTAERVLASIPPSATILLHFDIDVFSAHEMPAAYFPHDDGLTLAEGSALFGALAADPRVRLIEISEYASLRDGDQRAVRSLVELIANGLTPKEKRS
jgi:arginase